MSYADLLARGYVARRENDRPAALDLFKQAAAIDPRSIAARLEIAIELRDLGQLDAADAGFRAVLTEQPTQLRALIGLGHCARFRGEREAALAHFQAAAAVHPRNAWAAMEMAIELRELGRLDEAEARYRNVLAEQPGHLQALLGLANCARRRGERVAALAHFRAAAEAHPHDIQSRLELAAELRDRGEFDAAIAACEAVLADNPAEPRAWLSIGYTHHRAGRLESALAAFQSATAYDGAAPQPRVEAARLQRQLGRLAASRQTLLDLLERAPEQAEALQELGEQARLADNSDDAEALYRRAVAARPTNTGAVCGLSRTLLGLGRADEALRLLAGWITPPPEISATRVEILRQIGRWEEALALAREASAGAPRHFWLWGQRVEMELLSGNFGAAGDELRHPPADTTLQQAQVSRLRGLFAELQWQLDAAVLHYRQGQALDPRDGRLHNDLARLLMLTLDVEGAHEQLRQLARLNVPLTSLQGRSSNVSQTLLGQMLDEYLLDAAALGEMTKAGKLPPAERLTPLLALVRRNPDYTPAAIALLVALRQAGLLEASGPAQPAAGPWLIPRCIVQYWDSPRPPADLGALMQSWCDLNSDFEYRLFDDRAARDFLRHQAPEVLQAYRRSREPAQKADIFRLAWLFEHGGYYVDADDRCLGAIDTIVPAHATLAMYQEDIASIGNNFIGVAPRHAVIGRALQLAVTAVNRGDRDLLWFSTGPGLLTRAFAETLANSGTDCSVGLRGIVVLERTQLRRISVSHCSAAYKQTKRHWNKSSFARVRPRPAGLGAGLPDGPAAHSAPQSPG